MNKYSIFNVFFSFKYYLIKLMVNHFCSLFNKICCMLFPLALI